MVVGRFQHCVKNGPTEEGREQGRETRKESVRVQPEDAEQWDWWRGQARFYVNETEA